MCILEIWTTLPVKVTDEVYNEAVGVRVVHNPSDQLICFLEKWDTWILLSLTFGTAYKLV